MSDATRKTPNRVVTRYADNPNAAPTMSAIQSRVSAVRVVKNNCENSSVAPYMIVIARTINATSTLGRNMEIDQVIKNAKSENAPTCISLSLITLPTSGIGTCVAQNRTTQ